MDKRLVVVVEDDPAIRDVLTELLRSEGYTVEAISDGPSALERIKAISDRKGSIAAITLDLSLPGKDGTSVLKELKASTITRDVPVVIISASVRMLSPETRPLAAAVIRKPFDVMHLLETMSGLLGTNVPSTPFFSSSALANQLANH